MLWPKLVYNNKTFVYDVWRSASTYMGVPCRAYKTDEAKSMKFMRNVQNISSITPRKPFWQVSNRGMPQMLPPTFAAPVPVNPQFVKNKTRKIALFWF